MDHETPGTDRRIVVAVDGTGDGDRALRYAVPAAARVGAGLSLVHVVHPPVATAPLLAMFEPRRLDVVGNSILDDAESLVHQLVGARIEIRKVLTHGHRAEALIAAAGAAPIVLGSRSLRAHPKSAGFSTSAVAAHALGPVVCVPEGWQPQGEHGVVLVGVDGQAGSDAVLAAAFEAAAQRGARLTVLHAWRPTGRYGATLGASVAESWELQTEPVIWELVSALRGDHPDVDVQVVLRFERPEVALELESKSADLIVVGRRSDEARLGLALGPTVLTLMRGGCPVEVAPVPGERPLPAQRGATTARSKGGPVSAPRR